jgi:hypothetical protein
VDCSIRDAISAAAPGDTINFSALFNSPQTIILIEELHVDKNLTIQGPGANLLTISGNNAHRVFNLGSITTGISVTLSGMTIANGKPPTDLGGNTFGGGILSSITGTLTVADSRFINNSDCERPEYRRRRRRSL